VTKAKQLITRRGRNRKVQHIESAYGMPIRSVLEAFYAQGLNQAQIAEQLGISQRTVSAYTRQAGINLSEIRQGEVQP
jgi:predicted XRE-type DNA-binding protein